MSSTETRELIALAVERLQQEVPTLKQLKLVVRLELRAHGDHAPIWRVAVPGAHISKDPAGDARLDVAVARADFNKLATEADLAEWAQAYERGVVRISGEAAVTKLLGSVFKRQLVRTRS